MSELLAGHQPVAGAAYRRVSLQTSGAKRADREWLLLPAVGVLVGTAWLISRAGTYSPGSSAGYFLGLAGGVALLMVFLYPLRKRVRLLHSCGAAKGWFALHMACGIGGPFLILAHSRFHIGSINAGVALTCMLLVAGSGIIGRFIYVRIHHGLYGTRATLSQLESDAGLTAGQVRSKLHFAPRVEGWLKAYSAAALERPNNPLLSFWSFISLGARARWTYLRCVMEFTRIYRNHAKLERWDESKHRRHLAAAKGLVDAYLSNVQRVAQFSRYERLFSLWHILHVPLVWMLVLSAIAHVVAVHAY